MDAPAQVAVAVVVLLAALVVVGLLVRAAASRSGRGVRSRRIRVVGVGGGGGNAVDAMIRGGTNGVEFTVFNTDAQALRGSIARSRVQIGREITHGLGAGGDPAIGEQAARDDGKRIQAALAGSDLVFVTAGLGGGTGSGGAPVIATIARELGALTVGVVTRPFEFEGTPRRLVAHRAREALLASVDTLITIPNDRVHQIVPADATLAEAFGVVDDVLRQAVEGIVDLITERGLVNLDFADVRTVMANGGPAIMGMGRARGEDRAATAARMATSSPLLEDEIDGATGIIVGVAGSTDLQLGEVAAAADLVRSAADPDANVIFGATFDPSLGDEIRVTVIATGIPARAGDATDGAVPTDSTAPSSRRDRRSSRPPADAITDEAGLPPESGVGGLEVPAVSPAQSAAFEVSELDVPSFMRRKPPVPPRRQA